MLNRRLSNKLFLLILLILFCINISACSGEQTLNKKSSASRKQITTIKKEAAAKQQTETSTVKNGSAETNNNMAVSKSSTQNSSALSQTTNSSGSNGIVIVIDPGHANRANLEKEPIAPGSSLMKIKDGGGATGVFTKTPEYVVNRNVAFKLKALLSAKGYKVIMTKTKDYENPGNVDRAEVGNKNKAKLVIRIHADSCANQSVNGATMLIPDASDNYTKSIYCESKRCGQIVLNTLIKEVGMNNRGLAGRSDLTGFNWSTVPVILVEMGFISNPAEDKRLCSDSYENKIAAALSDGIVQAVSCK